MPVGWELTSQKTDVCETLSQLGEKPSNDKEAPKTTRSVPNCDTAQGEKESQRGGTAVARAGKRLQGTAEQHGEATEGGEKGGGIQQDKSVGCECQIRMTPIVNLESWQEGEVRSVCK
eukprot:5607855-Amphidinium_carterae.3